jgi:hypothetical protein
MAQKIARRSSLQSAALIAEASAVIDWRFGMFINFDIDTYYGPSQISILCQNGPGRYMFYRYPRAGAPAPGRGDRCGQPSSALAPSDDRLGLPAGDPPRSKV